MNSLQLLDRLIGFPTISSSSNLGLIDFARAFLRERGADVRVLANQSGTKANLFGTIGPADQTGVILSGHTDVVPVEGQAWVSDPFRLVERGGRYFGRGTADMKGFLACALNAADRASRQNLAAPLHLALSYDEEIGCVGVRPMLEMLQEWSPKPRFCIVGEPTSMQVALGHKGKIAARATCCGLEAHSALAPKALNAIHLAVDLIDRLRARQDDIALYGAADPAYEIPYTTIHAGKIAGGIALNIVPNRAVVDFEIRHPGGVDPAAILRAIMDDAAAIAAAQRRRFPAADIRIEVVNEYPALQTEDADIIGLARELLPQATLTKVAFGSEAGLFQSRLGIATVVCGPGSMDQGHKPNEFIEPSQLVACDTMMDRLIERLKA
jgi:acetylornithine deacetylase